MQLDTTVFRAWCTAKSIQTCLEIRLNPEDGSRYTVFQQRPEERIEKERHQQLLEVPLQACITADSSEELADRLLLEKNLGESSEFAPFLNLFPSANSFQRDLPRFWSPERLATITDGGQLQQALKEDCPRWENKYSAYMWALACVDSRSHFLPDGRYSLTPVLDMINHDPSVETSLRIKKNDVNTDTKECSLVLEVASDSLVLPPQSLRPWMDRLGPLFGSKASIAAKTTSEVCISYGDFTNLHTLLNYGFVMPNNQNNIENLSIRLINQPSPITLQVCRADGSLDNVGLGKLRLALATPQEREIQPEQRYLPTKYISQRNEEEVYGLVAAALQVAMEETSEGIKLTREDKLVSTYLKERYATFEAALQQIRLQFPQVVLEF